MLTAVLPLFAAAARANGSNRKSTANVGIDFYQPRPRIHPSRRRLRKRQRTEEAEKLTPVKVAGSRCWYATPRKHLCPHFASATKSRSELSDGTSFVGSVTTGAHSKSSILGSIPNHAHRGRSGDVPVTAVTGIEGRHGFHLLVSQSLDDQPVASDRHFVVEGNPHVVLTHA
jgi:hypothetical protein